MKKSEKYMLSLTCVAVKQILAPHENHIYIQLSGFDATPLAASNASNASI